MKRRSFLAGLLPAMAAPSVVNGFAVKPMQSSPFLDALMGYAMDNDRVLVLIQLNGGNDGLNTVIPVSNFSNYFNARSNVAIPEKKILKLNGWNSIGFHPSMSGMQQLFNEGKLNIVQSVGYPNPNFSHFRATDIWMSGSDAEKVIPSGWGGRFLSEVYPGFPSAYPNATMLDPPAIKIGSLATLALQGPLANMAMSISNTSSFYQFINGVQDPAPATLAGNNLTYVRTVARQTQQYSSSIKNAASKVTQQVSYPDKNPLGEQLKIVARLIKGGLKTRIYMTTLGGFDTHSMQVGGADTTVGAHSALLKTVSDAIKAFMDDCKQLAIEDRVVGMTFSEFGRRIRSNSSLGTDHGAAAPLFVFGASVNPGMVGQNPEIGSIVGVDDNIPFQYDFRSVYATIMENWFCADPTTISSVLFRNYQSIPIFKTGTCTGATAGPLTDPLADPTQKPADTGFKVGPNPFVSQTRINFTARLGRVLIQVIDATGKLIRTVVDAEYADGNYSVTLQGEQLPVGVYYVRFQNGPAQMVHSVLKVRG